MKVRLKAGFNKHSRAKNGHYVEFHAGDEFEVGEQEYEDFKFKFEPVEAEAPKKAEATSPKSTPKPASTGKGK